ncbi:hypothetical protein AV530_014808 [Patagioenas fasciata monilis]|uniref:Uncharacterized protein n=1 Tax=Patagioenas fasciata monilis TaxID=372326 RepID=A0A1V4L041_PATFA|nr:hypothetical protein AV530_014808 [Patagioenas fasciata monilis]
MCKTFSSSLFTLQGKGLVAALSAVENLLRLKTKPCPTFSMEVCTVQTSTCIHPFHSFLCQLSVMPRPLLELLHPS